MPEPTSAQYSLTIRVRLEHRPGRLGRVTTAIGETGGTIGAIDLIEVETGHMVRDISVDTAGPEHGERIIAAIDGVDGAEVIGFLDRTFRLHLGGKIEMANKAPVKTRDDLAAHLLLHTGRADVDTVLVGGEARVRGGKLVGADPARVRRLLDEAREHVLGARVPG